MADDNFAVEDLYFTGESADAVDNAWTDEIHDFIDIDEFIEYLKEMDGDGNER